MENLRGQREQRILKRERRLCAWRQPADVPETTLIPLPVVTT